MFSRQSTIDGKKDFSPKKAQAFDEDWIPVIDRNTEIRANTDNHDKDALAADQHALSVSCVRGPEMKFAPLEAHRNPTDQDIVFLKEFERARKQEEVLATIARRQREVEEAQAERAVRAAQLAAKAAEEAAKRHVEEEIAARDAYHRAEEIYRSAEVSRHRRLKEEAQADKAIRAAEVAARAAEEAARRHVVEEESARKAAKSAAVAAAETQAELDKLKDAYKKAERASQEVESAEHRRIEHENAALKAQKAFEEALRSSELITLKRTKEESIAAQAVQTALDAEARRGLAESAYFDLQVKIEEAKRTLVKIQDSYLGVEKFRKLQDDAAEKAKLIAERAYIAAAESDKYRIEQEKLAEFAKAGIAAAEKIKRSHLEEAEKARHAADRALRRKEHAELATSEAMKAQHSALKVQALAEKFFQDARQLNRDAETARVEHMVSKVRQPSDSTISSSIPRRPESARGTTEDIEPAAHRSLGTKFENIHSRSMVDYFPVSFNPDNDRKSEGLHEKNRDIERPTETDTSRKFIAYKVRDDDTSDDLHESLNGGGAKLKEETQNKNLDAHSKHFDSSNQAFVNETQSLLDHTKKQIAAEQEYLDRAKHERIRQEQISQNAADEKKELEKVLSNLILKLKETHDALADAEKQRNNAEVLAKHNIDWANRTKKEAEAIENALKQSKIELDKTKKALGQVDHHPLQQQQQQSPQMNVKNKEEDAAARMKESVTRFAKKQQRFAEESSLKAIKTAEDTEKSAGKAKLINEQSQHDESEKMMA